MSSRSGLIELVTVVIGRQKSDHDEFVGGYLHLADPDRGVGKSGGGDVERALESQELFHGTGGKARRFGTQDASWAGFRSNARIPFPMKFTVVSYPAKMSR